MFDLNRNTDVMFEFYEMVAIRGAMDAPDKIPAGSTIANPGYSPMWPLDKPGSTRYSGREWDGKIIFNKDGRAVFVPPECIEFNGYPGRVLAQKLGHY